MNFYPGVVAQLRRSCFLKRRLTTLGTWGGTPSTFDPDGNKSTLIATTSMACQSICYNFEGWWVNVVHWTIWSGVFWDRFLFAHHVYCSNDGELAPLIYIVTKATWIRFPRCFCWFQSLIVGCEICEAKPRSERIVERRLLMEQRLVMHLKKNLHPGRLTWNLQNDPWKERNSWSFQNIHEGHVPCSMFHPWKIFKGLY